MTDRGTRQLLTLAGLAAGRATADLARAMAEVRRAEAAVSDARIRAGMRLPAGNADPVALRLATLARIKARGGAEALSGAVATARAIAETKRMKAARAIGREAALAALIESEAKTHPRR